jgi:predicted RNA-binding Zn-ribbon protein involved in translation (DUF1610 family)
MAQKAAERRTGGTIRCPSCGWTGAKRETVVKEVDLEVTDYLRTALQTILASPVQHKCEYSCPVCGRLLATELKFFQSYYDQERTV